MIERLGGNTNLAAVAGLDFHFVPAVAGKIGADGPHQRRKSPAAGNSGDDDGPQGDRIAPLARLGSGGRRGARNHAA